MGVILFVFIALAAVYYFRFFNSNKPTTISVSTTLTDDAVFAVQARDISYQIKTFFNTEFGRQLLTTEVAGYFYHSFSTLDSVFQNSDNLKKFVTGHEVNLSFHRTSISHYDFLVLAENHENFTEKDIIAFLGNFTAASPAIRKFDNKTIYDFAGSNENPGFAFALFDQYFAFSKNPVLVEDAIRILSGEEKVPTTDTKVFTAGNMEFMVRLTTLNDLLQQYFEVSSELNFLPGLNGNGDYSMTDKDALFILRGNLSNIDSQNYFINCLASQPPKKSDIFRVLPSRVATLYALNISDYTQWYSRYLSFVDEETYFSTLREFEDRNQVSVKNDFIPLLYGTVSAAYFEPFGDHISSSKILAAKVLDTEKAISFFRLSPSESDTVRQTSYKGYSIYPSYLAGSFELVLGKPFGLEGQTWFVNIRDYLIFSENINLIYRIVDDYIQMQTLSTSASFNKFYENLSSQFNFLAFINPARITQWAGNSLSHEPENPSGIHFLRNFSALAFQLTSGKSHFYNEILLLTEQQQRSGQEFMMESLIDTQALAGPFSVINHNSGKYELVVFDKKNQMYLVDVSGNILFKKKLDGPIVGDLYQVDLYNNRKLQYCFTTSNHLQLIDRLGRNVANYPIRLSSTTYTGASVFDFRKNKNTKSFVGCDNQYIFGYSKSGQPLSGWRPARLNGNLEMPLKYFVKNGKTYLLGVTDKGFFYLWDQNGKKVQQLELETRFYNPFHIQFEPSFEKTHLISLDSSGNTYYIYLNGEVEVHSFGKWASDAFFNYVDIDANETKELVFTQGNTLLAYSHKGEVVLSTQLPYAIGSHPEFIAVESELYIAYLDKNSPQLILCNLDGVLHQSFPINCGPGYSFVDIDHDGRLELTGTFNDKIFIARF